MLKKKKTIGDLIKEYFKKHPKQNLQHDPVVDWVEERYFKLYRCKPRDIWRSIRSLHEQDFLVKVRKGIYRYDPNSAKQRTLEDFAGEVLRIHF